MKNRLIVIILIALIILTGWFWVFVCIPYWVIKGKTLPIFEKLMDYIYKLGEK